MSEKKEEPNLIISCLMAILAIGTVLLIIKWQPLTPPYCMVDEGGKNMMTGQEARMTTEFRCDDFRPNPKTP
jgi:hypothetical protein